MAVKNIANIMIAMYMEIQIASIASSLLISCLPFWIKVARLHASCVAREHRQGNDGDGYRDVYKELDHHFAHHARTLPFCVSIVIHSRGVELLTRNPMMDFEFPFNSFASRILRHFFMTSTKHFSGHTQLNLTRDVSITYGEGPELKRLALESEWIPGWIKLDADNWG